MQTCSPLRNLTIGEFAFDKKDLYFLDGNTTIEEAAKFLKEKNILSAPVKHPHTHQFIGIIDMMEICRYTTFGKLVDIERGESLTEETEFETHMFPNVMVGDLVNNNPNCRISVFSPSERLQEVLKAFEDGAHRVLVDMGKQLPNRYCLVSQSDVVNFLAEHFKKHSKDEGSKFVNKKVKDLRLKCPVLKPVVSMKTTDKALDGFASMYRQEVPAVAIVSEDGTLVGTLSSSDLRGITKDSIKRLLLPVVDFFRMMTGSPPKPPVVAKMDSTLGEIVKKVTDSKIHRVWIVDDENKPIGIMSLTDIIAAVCEN